MNNIYKTYQGLSPSLLFVQDLLHLSECSTSLGIQCRRAGIMTIGQLICSDDCKMTSTRDRSSQGKGTNLQPDDR